MDRLGKIIKSLKETEYSELFDQIASNNADKSSSLLAMAREQNLSDKECFEILKIKPNAYYTLKSRLNQKIENYLLSKMDAPKMDLVQNVHYASEHFLLTDKDRLIVMLKKLEKELLDYDLPGELIKVYQNLKQLYIHDSELFYSYSQLYNKQVAYSLAVNKTDDLVGNYFNTYSNFYFSRELIHIEKLKIIRKEINTIANLYQSHRLFILESLVEIYHLIFIEKETNPNSLDDLEEKFAKVDFVFEKYPNDSFYFQIRLAFDYLRFEYYHTLHLSKKEEFYIDEIKTNLTLFIENYSYYTFSPRYLISILERSSRLMQPEKLLTDYEGFVSIYSTEPSNYTQYITFYHFKAACFILNNNFSDAEKVLSKMRNEISFKRFPHIELELKLLLAYAYTQTNKEDLFNQLIKSVHRQIRNSSELEYESAKVFVKCITKIIHFPTQKDKILSLFQRFKAINTGHDQILTYLNAIKLPN